MSTMTWHSANGAPPPPTDTTRPFNIAAPPKVDIWRRTESIDAFTAPYIYTAIQPLAFNRISTTVSVSGQWKAPSDQGGILFAFAPQGSNDRIRWIKAGIEYFKGALVAGVVATDRLSDWSGCPIPAGETNATFEAVREGHNLWIYLVRKDGQRQPLREVKWAFVDYMDAAEKYQDMRVGVYAAKPSPNDDDETAGIQARFRDLQVEVHA